MEVFLATLSPMLVLFICMAIGFTLNKTKVVPDNAGTVMSKLENYVFVPALCFNAFAANCTLKSLRENADLFIYSILILAFALTISFILVRFFTKDAYIKNIYKYALTFGNFGFMGNAIVPAILGATFGDTILYYYLLFTLPLQVAVNTWGIYSMIPKDRNAGNPLKNLINPIFIAIFLGIICGLSGLGEMLPNFANTVLDYLAGCMAPVAMILTGFIIGGYSVKELLGDYKIYIVTALRLFIIPAAIVAILILIKASDLVVCCATFAYATPLGMNTVVFPAAFGGDTKPGASMAMISHTLSVISIPIFYSIVAMIIF